MYEGDLFSSLLNNKWLKQSFTLKCKKNVLKKKKYVEDPENSRGIKDIFFRNTALKKTDREIVAC